MLKVAIVGASGYSGAELVRILAGHPAVRIASLHAESSAGQAFEELHPRLRHLHRGALQPFEPAQLAGKDVVFLALPHGASAKAAAALRGRVGRVIDLSGDLRLPDADSYRRWYGAEHPAPELLGQAAYGLPELFGCALPGATLVACAGCYATVSQLAAAPGLALGAAVGDDVVITGISGTSGAGRKAELALSFSEVGGNLRAYRVGRHQHAPEIAQGLVRHSGRAARVTFVPVLAPLVRGILVTATLRNAGGLSQAQAVEAWRSAYAGKPFVRVQDGATRQVEVADVVGSNSCDLSVVVDDSAGTIVVTGVIDNLIKGAAGQAVQVMNLACGLPETAGLLPSGADAPAEQGCCNG